MENETARERESRLQQVTTNQRTRLESETAGERESRLQKLTTNQRRRVENETAGERELRLQRYQQSHRRRTARDSQLPLFEQPSVRSKMASFHEKMRTVQVAMCSTCFEKFPGMQLRSASLLQECVRCSRDHHIPKLYSSANNRAVPPELQVTLCVNFVCPIL